MNENCIYCKNDKCVVLDFKPKAGTCQVCLARKEKNDGSKD